MNPPMNQNNDSDCIAIDFGIIAIVIGWKTAIVIGASVALICFAVYQ